MKTEKSESAVRATVTPGVYELYAPAREGWNRRTIAVWEVTISPARGNVSGRSPARSINRIEVSYSRHEQYERMDRSTPWVYKGPGQLGVSRVDTLQAQASLADWLIASLSGVLGFPAGAKGSGLIRGEVVVTNPKDAPAPGVKARAKAVQTKASPKDGLLEEDAASPPMGEMDEAAPMDSLDYTMGKGGKRQ